jgi:hypothetical protein
MENRIKANRTLSRDKRNGMPVSSVMRRQKEGITLR